MLTRRDPNDGMAIEGTKKEGRNQQSEQELRNKK
jgi:hypothetical protein